VVATLVWASRQNGGIDGTVSRAENRVRSTLDNATSSGDVKAVVDWLQLQYHQTGAYPSMSQGDQDAHRDPSFSGIDYLKCSSSVAIVSAFTAGGTVSQLLVNGGSWGKVDGVQRCPTNLGDPAPWTVPTTVPAH
jgi:hypothetical protein